MVGIQSGELSEIRLSVNGMRCQGCADAVKSALEAVDGVKSACVTLASNSAVVKGDAAPEALIQALAEKDFKAAVA